MSSENGKRAESKSLVKKVGDIFEDLRETPYTLRLTRNCKEKILIRNSCSDPILYRLSNWSSQTTRLDYKCSTSSAGMRTL